MERLSVAENLEYFNSEPLDARIRGVVCKQSRPVSETRREEMLAEAQELLRRSREDPTFQVEMPESFGGFRLLPDSMEFYQGSRNSLNDRILFQKGEPAETSAEWLKGDGEWRYQHLEP